jgi:hypothetical protein
MKECISLKFTTMPINKLKKKIKTKTMTNQEYNLQLSALKSTLEIVLIEAEKKGKEISMAYECGMYIGTIKGIITHLEELTQDNG